MNGHASDRERAIYRVTLVGSLCNFALLGFKAVAGFVGHSPAMIADAVHSLSDFVTDIFVLFFVRLSNKPQDYDHEYGHGKYETLATSLIGLSLLVVGVGLFYDAAGRIWDYFHGVVIPQPGTIAFAAAGVSIAIKEALYWYTAYYGRKYDSQAVIANAWHHRSDAFSSIATLFGIGGAILLGEQWTVLDPIAAALVSVLIAKVALNLIRRSMGDLLDQALPKDEEETIMAVIREFKEVECPHNLRTRHIGTRHSVEMHVRMDGNMTVLQSHAITRAMESRLREFLGGDTIINIHVEPKK
ncbi:MAG: cation transporter [Bacteroidaceae bacterium]|nr:cation transporter [Bacteroidaceae bacterium]